MLEASLDFLKCVRCNSGLYLDAFDTKGEVVEGFLNCNKCDAIFPIIKKIPILWNDFSEYLSSRRILGGRLYRETCSQKLKDFVKSALSGNPREDRTYLEDRWSGIYEGSQNSDFYSTVKKTLELIPRTQYALEYGCSVGTMASELARTHDYVLGVDRSFSALQVAKKSPRDNLDFVAADLMSPVFGNCQFGLIVALNILEIVEPAALLKRIAGQISSGHLVISDPYDFERGANSVKNPLDELTLRESLEQLGFEISAQTRQPSFIPWNLKLNPRATLNYKADLIICQKQA